MKGERVRRQRAEKGPVLLFTGDGKGKTSAAMGTALRLAGRGKRVLVLQFAKPPGGSGEERALKKLAPEVRVKALGKCRLDLSARPRRVRDLDDVARQWDRALALMSLARWDAVVLDELNFVVCAGYLPARKVTAFLDARPSGLAVVLTGRGKSRDIVRRADYVTEMKNRKHPFDPDSIGTAIRGIEF